MFEVLDEGTGTPMDERPDPLDAVDNLLTQASSASSFDKTEILFRAIQYQGHVIRDLRRRQTESESAKPWWRSMTVVSALASYLPKFAILGIVLYMVYNGLSPGDAVEQTRTYLGELLTILGLLGFDKLATAFSINGRFRATSRIK